MESVRNLAAKKRKRRKTSPTLRKEAHRLQSLRGSAPSGDASLRETSSHDLDGNLLSDRKNTYTWNSENRLTEVLSQDRKTKVTYTYDYQGRRTTKKTFTRPAPSEDFQQKTSNLYLYDGWNLLAEIETNDKSKIPTHTCYTWGRDLSGTLQGAGGVGGLLAISESSTGILPVKSKGKTSETTPATTAHQSTYYPAYDANGNVGQLVDEKGIVAAAYNYDPFGNVTAMVGEKAHDNPWRFSTKPVEGVTGWSYYGFRYYMPTTGRWASRDPIEELGGTNIYGFIGNAGVNHTDYLGKLSPIVLAALAVLALGLIHKGLQELADSAFPACEVRGDTLLRDKQIHCAYNCMATALNGGNPVIAMGTSVMNEILNVASGAHTYAEALRDMQANIEGQLAGIAKSPNCFVSCACPTTADPESCCCPPFSNTPLAETNL